MEGGGNDRLWGELSYRIQREEADWAKKGRKRGEETRREREDDRACDEDSRVARRGGQNGKREK